LQAVRQPPITPGASATAIAIATRAAMTKECPMCSEIMRVHLSERVDKIPGTTQVVRRPLREWQCPECDYFEEVEPDEIEVE
jgi:C4-type Zn-finger protein